MRVADEAVVGDGKKNFLHRTRTSCRITLNLFVLLSGDEWLKKIGKFGESGPRPTLSFPIASLMSLWLSKILNAMNNREINQAQ